MTVKPRLLVLTVLLGTLVLPALASARQGQGSRGQQGPGPGAAEGRQVLTNVRFLTRYLHLTSAQVTQLQGFLQTLQTAEQGVRSDREAACAQLRTDLDAAAPDPTTLGTDYLALVATKTQAQAALAAFETSFEAVLTADQLAKFQALVDAAGSHADSGALPGCPPADSASSS